jgi:hypothetical protein
MTKEKLRFNANLRELVPPEQLWKDFQGDVDFEYEHATYWPALLKLCEEKHSEAWARWVQAGKHYGESEIYMKGGNAPSATPQENGALENTTETVSQKEDIQNEKEKKTVPLKDAESKEVPVKEPVSESTTDAKAST